MKKIYLFLFLIIIIFSPFTKAQNEENFAIHPAQPAVVTCPGQNPDGLMVKVVLENKDINFSYQPFLQAEDINDYSTLIIAVGHSCKGVGAAGKDFDYEFERTKKLMAQAEEKNIFVILTHLGGTGRRDERSDKLLDLVSSDADYMIVSEASDFDGYFSEAAAEYDIPLTLVDNISEIKAVLSSLFISKSNKVSYFIRGDKKDKTIVINAGTHGSEKASHLAALKLLKAEIIGGQLVVIPRANPEALAKNLRNNPGEGDLNRAFPGKKNGTKTEQRAEEIFTLIKNYSPAAVIDLHESEDFNSTNKNFLGQSIIAAQNEKSVWQAANAVELLNQKIVQKREKFTLISHPIQGSLSWAAAEFLELPAFTVETCQKLKLEKRIDYQLKVISTLLKKNGVEIKWP